MQQQGPNPINKSAIVLGTLVLLAACGGGGSSTPPVNSATATPTIKPTATPTASPAPERLYFSYGDTASTTTSISYFTSPFSSASSATSFPIATGSGLSNLVVDPNGNVIVGESSLSTITSYSRPNPTSSAQFLITPGFVSVGMAYGPTGTFFVANNTNASIETAPVPLSATTTFTPLITAGIGAPWTVNFDAAGNLYVADHASNVVDVYAPPLYTGAPIVLTAGTGTQDTFACAYDSVTNQIIVDEASPGSGNILTYNLPITATATPTANIAYTTAAPFTVASDKLGNLYVSSIGATTDSIQVFAPPFVSATNPTPLITLPLPSVGGTGYPAFSMGFGS